jgi:hypothetical protein
MEGSPMLAIAITQAAAEHDCAECMEEISLLHAEIAAEYRQMLAEGFVGGLS